MLINYLHAVPGSKFRCFYRHEPNHRVQRSGPRLVLIRGLPGSGKSTLARALATHGFLHLEADQFFMVGGTYRFIAERVKEAHAWCQGKAREALRADARVEIANTFTTVSEMSPYLQMYPSPVVVEATGAWPNIHGVPGQTLTRMANRWESLPKAWTNIEVAEELSV